MIEIVFWLTAMTLLMDWFKFSLTVRLGRILDAEGDLLVADEAVDGGNTDHNRTGNIASHSLAGRDALKKDKRVAAEMAFHCAEKNVKRGCMVMDQGL